MIGASNVTKNELFHNYFLRIMIENLEIHLSVDAFESNK